MFVMSVLLTEPTISDKTFKVALRLKLDCVSDYENPSTANYQMLQQKLKILVSSFGTIIYSLAIAMCGLRF